jgi:signal transduction histidine kinase
MSEETDRRRRGEQLAFFGTIGADVSHDIRNVLSVIGEYAGLLDDLLSQAKRRKGPDPEKLKNLAAKTTRQVRKGTEIMQRFSSFSHAADHETASFDLTALTGNIAALARRRVTLAGCTLEIDLPDEPLSLSGHPFTTQYAIFSGIQIILEALEAGGVIKLALTSEASTAAVCISAQVTGATADPLSDQTSKLSAVMSELDGRVEASSSGGTVSLLLTLPVQ